MILTHPKSQTRGIIFSMQPGLVWSGMNTKSVFPGLVLFAASRLLSTLQSLLTEAAGAGGSDHGHTTQVLGCTLQGVRVETPAYGPSHSDSEHLCEVVVLLASHHPCAGLGVRLSRSLLVPSSSPVVLSFLSRVLAPLVLVCERVSTRL